MMSGGSDVGTRREQLAELDERRPELVEHLAQVLSSLRRLALDLAARPRAAAEIGQAMVLEPVAEAVPNRDLRDLRKAPEVSCRGLSHRFSVTDYSSGASEAGRCRAHGPGGVRSDSTRRYAIPTCGRSESRSTHR